MNKIRENNRIQTASGDNRRNGWRKYAILIVMKVWFPALRIRVAAVCLLLAGALLLPGCSANRREGSAWNFRSEEEEAQSSRPDEAGTGAEPGDGGGQAPEQPAAEEDAGERETEPGYVYICGAVVNPGVYQVTEGTRVFEVIALAGGLTAQADDQWLNQAETVRDGQKLQIYTKEETAALKEAGQAAGTDGSGEGDPGTSGGASGEEKVNINTADRNLLMTLPGIGEAKAEAILKYRQEHGNFGSIEDICQVSGIKEAVFSNIEDRITV